MICPTFARLHPGLAAMLILSVTLGSRPVLAGISGWC